MKLAIKPFPSERLSEAWHMAAASGWLMHGPDGIRCGFGGALRHIEVDSLDRVGTESEVFQSIDCDDMTLVTGFAAVPFSRHEQFTIAIPRIVIVALSTGETVAVCEEDTDVLAALGDRPSPSPAPKAHQLAFEPSPDEYATAVAEAVEHLRRGELDKVVLARSCRGEFSHDVTGGALASRLHDLEPSCTIYSLPTGLGRRFVGASPELLVSVRDSQIQCHPLAGTIANDHSPDRSTYATWLMGSSKNRAEHRYVVDDIVQRLSAIASEVSADAEPSIVTLRSVTHLGSFIRGRSVGAPSSLLALQTLHPTPAVGGLPRENAVELIEKLEPVKRGFYSGAVGWCNAAGDGSWWVGIRGITISNRQFEVWAGAGIVADSDPIAEREETRNKLDSVLHAIGVGTLN